MFDLESLLLSLLVSDRPIRDFDFGSRIRDLSKFLKSITDATKKNINPKFRCQENAKQSVTQVKRDFTDPNWQMRYFTFCQKHIPPCVTLNWDFRK